MTIAQTMENAVKATISIGLLLCAALSGCANNQGSTMTPAQQAWHLCFANALGNSGSPNFSGELAYAGQACGPYPQN